MTLALNMNLYSLRLNLLLHDVYISNAFLISCLGMTPVCAGAWGGCVTYYPQTGLSFYGVEQRCKDSKHLSVLSIASGMSLNQIMMIS